MWIINTAGTLLKGCAIVDLLEPIFAIVLGIQDGLEIGVFSMMRRGDVTKNKILHHFSSLINTTDLILRLRLKAW